VAKKADAKALYLVHYPTGRFFSGDPAAEARKTFPGPVVLALDMMRVEF
jgi:ribonuclease BN (tRNA processing enzyme)